MAAEIKPSYGLERTILSEVVPLAVPFTVNLSVSTACNFKCNYCYHSLPKDQLDAIGFRRELMDWQMFLKAAEQISAFPVPLKTIFLFGWGEPLCNNLLPDMVSHLKQLKVAEQIAFITNGALLERNTSLALIKAGLDVMRVSLQGMSSKRYLETCKAKVDFEELVSNIRFFYENKTECQLYVKVIDVTLEDGDEERFYSTFRDISDRMYIERIVPGAKGVQYSDEVMARKSETIDDTWGNSFTERQVCPLCFYTLNILPNGDVYPCSCAIEDPAGLGNIRRTPLNDIWNGAVHRDFLKMQLRKERKNNPVCRDCINPNTSAKVEDDLDAHAEDILPRFIP
jgi:GTP 3',8-cyclase